MSLRDKYFSLNESINQTWSATIRSEERDELTSPEFWANVSAKLRRFDHVMVQTEDGTFWADLLVTSVGRGWAKMYILNYVENEPVSLEYSLPLEGLTIRHRGAYLKWCVIRDSDVTVLSEGLDSRAAAYAAGAEYLKQLETTKAA